MYKYRNINFDNNKNKCGFKVAMFVFIMAYRCNVGVMLTITKLFDDKSSKKTVP